MSEAPSGPTPVPTNGPARASRWFSAVLPVVREGGPITLLLVLILFGLNLYFFRGQLGRQQDLTEGLVRQLLDEKNARIQDAIRCLEARRHGEN